MAGFLFSFCFVLFLAPSSSIDCACESYSPIQIHFLLCANRKRCDSDCSISFLFVLNIAFGLIALCKRVLCACKSQLFLCPVKNIELREYVTKFMALFRLLGKNRFKAKAFHVYSFVMDKIFKFSFWWFIFEEGLKRYIIEADFEAQKTRTVRDCNSAQNFTFDRIYLV